MSSFPRTMFSHRVLKQLLIKHPEGHFVAQRAKTHSGWTKPVFGAREQATIRKAAIFAGIEPVSIGLPDKAPVPRPIIAVLPKGRKRLMQVFERYFTLWR